jgi:tetratricopeptide (TPR) repeat protein
MVSGASRFLALVWLAVALPQGGRPQGPNSSPEKASANSAYEAKDWAKAESLYGQITTAEPDNGRAWYRLGIARHGLGLEEKSIAAFQKAIESGVPPSFGEYQIALCYSALHNKDKAFESLDKAIRNGYSDPDALKSSSELAELRDDSRFPKVVEDASRNAKPCAFAPESRQFDFWVGEWDVVTTKGEMPAGSSRIERVLGDCVILENWKSNGSSYEGKSYNTYNTTLKRWEQFWVDNSQGMVHFYGQLLKNGVMDYYTDEIPQPDGTKVKRHMEFIPLGPDKVRQVSHSSADHGKTWQPQYDFTYNRKK